ncbi:glycosyl transferase group 1 [Nitrosococcus halophilus Nc 4]|uniref:Glycosyl transferase group 1 n=1 Tax=Nitrosococcus halophilus (strain Nc4) TaxID=472759 RepID=D5C2K7_NITHN|nr:glycosyltransferase [Nitrosococcus halophilus]ADE16682.1 glycosyl transferase group 1 [Nitrosococcus halophilus Nc 4]
MPRAKGIILYDFLQVPGGAERVTLLLARAFPEFDLCVGARNHGVIPDGEMVGLKCIELGSIARSPAWRALKTMRLFRSRTAFLSRYEVVLYSGVYAPVAVHHHKGRNILYCHTSPLRFAYDLKDYYLGQCPWWQKPAFQALIAYSKLRYEAAIAQMDLVIANSECVARKYRHYLGQETIVIYPPCEIERFRWQGQGNYYLSLARLEPHKRVDIIIQAFLQMPDKRLVVVSEGSDLPRLRHMAEGARNIHFVGWPGQDQLSALLGNAIATLYIPKDEDFGMSPVESMAAGKPVIGVAEGGLLETIIDGETGLLMPPNPTPMEIISAVQTLTPKRALEMREACERQARRFNKEIFLEKMGAVLKY